MLLFYGAVERNLFGMEFHPYNNKFELQAAFDQIYCWHFLSVLFNDTVIC